jgi:hypothetical protein
VTSEIASTARPTGLRVAGFACVALGAVLAGVGATREWATVGFAGDTDHRLDVPWNGIDGWEGKVVLLAATSALVVMLAMGISGSEGTRRALAIGLMLSGLLCIALPMSDAIRAENRFGGVEGVDKLAKSVAIKTGFTEEVVRQQLEALIDRGLRVEVSPGLWLTVAGGVLLVAGGGLSLTWSGKGAPGVVETA